jgi:zinc D-Ala-D-Ala carboxypeptidase
MAKTKKTNFSTHISTKEAWGSETAKKLDIENKPPRYAMENMKIIASELFEPLRKEVGHPILVTSFYRCKELNEALKGAENSKHITGEAIDIDSSGNKSNAEIFYIIKNNFDYDKLIWELGDDKNPDWIHISYVKGHNRKLTYQAFRQKGKGYSTYKWFDLDNKETEDNAEDS